MPLGLRVKEGWENEFRLLGAEEDLKTYWDLWTFFLGLRKT
jgi:hypothetical protein